VKSLTIEAPFAGHVSLRADEWAKVEKSAQVVRQIVERGEPAYGINTGFGKLARVHIPDDQLAQLQVNLVRSHAVGVGPSLSAETVGVASFLKLKSLAKGFSGVRRETLERAIAIHNAGLRPVIPAQGSVGASGDLAPLAHYTLALMGEAWFLGSDGRAEPAFEILRRHGLSPIELGPKEGLAFLNGTQISTALALDAYQRSCQAFRLALIAGAMSVDAARGSDAPFDPRIHEVRRQPGQILVAEALKRLLAGSQIRASHLENDERVQDPYSLRCQPQVMGACHDLLASAKAVLEAEIESVTDNPLIFPDTGEVISGGNFHAEPVAFAADQIAIAAAEIGALSERRIALLIDANLSGLPPFLVSNPGLNSGFMIAHVTAAALASENKTLAHPASVDSLPTSANQEDHVSMATWAGRKAAQIAENTFQIVLIEAMAAAQGIDFHRPLRSSDRIEAAHTLIRRHVPFFEHDRYLAGDLDAMQAAANAILEEVSL